MAMTMTGEAVLPASKEVVWAKLNDPEVLKACIPGCEQLTKDDDNHMSAVVKVKLGPVKASFKGRVELHRSRPAERLSHPGRGRGRRRRLRQGRRQGHLVRRGGG